MYKIKVKIFQEIFIWSDWVKNLTIYLVDYTYKLLQKTKVFNYNLIQMQNIYNVIPVVIG